MKTPDVFVEGLDGKNISMDIHIGRMEMMPKIRARAEKLADRISKKAKELKTHDMDEEIKELQSILDDLQHFQIVISAYSTKKPYPSLNGAILNPGASSTTDDPALDDDSDKML